MEMTKVEIKGDIVDNQTAEVYSFYGLPSVSPQGVSDAIANATDGVLDLEIASNGGDVFAASEIYTMLKNYSGTVNVQIQGLAASAASVIAMAGDNVSMSPTALLMIHQAWVETAGNKDDLSHEADVLDKIDNSIVAAYEDKTGLDEGTLLNLMTQETWLTAKEAVDKGFADNIAFHNDDDGTDDDDDDTEEDLFAASTGMMLSRSAIKAGRMALNRQKDTSAPAPHAPQNKTEAAKPTLRQRKLAILMPKNGEE